MWSFVSNCGPNISKVFGEPYCGGPTGLWKGGSGADWKVGVGWVVSQVVSRPWLAGLWLGDEPEILGVDYPSMCELSLYLKQSLIKAGRGDVFLTYNDGPESGQLSNGMCPGLDFFSTSIETILRRRSAGSRRPTRRCCRSCASPTRSSPKGKGCVK